MKQPTAWLLLLAACPQIAVAQARTATLVIEHVTIVDPANNGARTDMSVFVDGNRITAVRRSVDATPPASARVVNGAGKFLLPGLWDSHVHLARAGSCALSVLVANGITSVRDMGGGFREVRAWRDLVRSGRMVGPRIVLPGPILEDARWVEWVLGVMARTGDNAGLLDIQERVALRGVTDVPRVLDSIAGLRLDFIKVRTSNPQTFLTLLKEAKERGIAVAAHAPRMDLRLAAVEGLGSIEHTETVADALAALAPNGDARALGAELSRSGTWYTPTLITGFRWRGLPDSVVLRLVADTIGTIAERNRYVPATLRDSWNRLIDGKKYESPRQSWKTDSIQQMTQFRMIQSAGTGILAGSDLGSVLTHPGFSLHDELELLVRAGDLRPRDALRAAISNPPRFVSMHDSLSRIAPGQLADLVLLDANPLTNITNTRRIRSVILNGRLFERSQLDELLASAARRVVANQRCDAP